MNKIKQGRVDISLRVVRFGGQSRSKHAAGMFARREIKGQQVGSIHRVADHSRNYRRGGWLTPEEC